MSIVMKFGGTSVADAAAFDNVARIIAAQRNSLPVVVVSAMSGVTDSLLAATSIAAEGDTRQAIASLETVFTRHKTAASELLPDHKGADFLDELKRAADHLAAAAFGYLAAKAWYHGHTEDGTVGADGARFPQGTDASLDELVRCRTGALGD